MQIKLTQNTSIKTLQDASTGTHINLYAFGEVLHGYMLTP